MKIENIRREQHGNRPRVTATVTWEDCDRPSLDVYFETEEEFGQGLTCNPHAFLVGCLLPAMHHREKRIALDADICPELRENLITAMSWVRHWYYSMDYNLVNIEAGTKIDLQSPRTPERTGMFFSGGIDSYGTLCANRLNYPEGHPGSIKDGLLLYGQNIESDNRPESFVKAFTELSAVARESGVELIPVYSNVRLLDENRKLFEINQSGILAAVAHAFSRRLTTVCIAATDSIPGLRQMNKSVCIPLGTHPLLDPCYSSSDLRIRHDGITLSRFDKTKIIAGVDAALRNIKVCGPNWPGSNCGRCEKCIRTMLELLAAGALEKTDAFPLDDVSAELVSKVHIKKPDFDYTVEGDYLELIPTLREKGRHDLVDAIENVVKRAQYRKKGFSAKVKEIDRKYLAGMLSRTKKLVLSKAQVSGGQSPVTADSGKTVDVLTKPDR